MRNNLRRASLLLVILCCLACSGLSAYAVPPTPLPSPTPTPPLNSIQIGHCRTSTELEGLVEAERARGTVMDARPFAVNQTTGKLAFNGSTGRVSVVNTNPFVYKYEITVAQEELVSTALTDFLKLLLPQSLRTTGELQSGGASLTASRVGPTDKLTLIAKRLDGMTPPECKTSGAAAAAIGPACVANGAMYEAFNAIRTNNLVTLSAPAPVLSFNGSTPTVIGKSGAATPVNQEFASYTEGLSTLRDEEADATIICQAATDLNIELAKYDFKSYFDQLDKALAAINIVDTQAIDLEGMAADFNKEEDLKANAKAQKINCLGFNCVNQFDAYAKEARNVLRTYRTELDKLTAKAKEMQNMYLLTEQMKKKEGLFARTFTIIKKFELSQATIALNRTKLKIAGEANNQETKGNQSGTPGQGGSGNTPQPTEEGGTSSEGSGLTTLRNSFLARGGGDGDGAGREESGSGEEAPAKEPAKAKEGDTAPAGQSKEVLQIGRPRFMLSGGLVYAPLPRRTFKSVKGFALDAQGKPTGTGTANIIGYDENSSRRLMPMVLLNTRLLSYQPASLYFSFGVSAKKDDNMDIEYLFGPAVGLLNDRALFTFGVYGGKTQNLVSDVKIGDALPDDIGDAKLFRKSYTWKPGFSFSYSFSRTKKNAVAGGGGGGSSSTANDLKNEIRIGNIPFNLAVGMAYTSLEQRTYDEVVGLARDRQGNLTNGTTLTRIVGLTSSSNYRLTPLALLHSRLTNFGKYDFYFSTGITGKKTDNDFDVEYLLGGSVNLYQRKVFLTVGAFAGKQQVLGGDFFEGAKIGQSQSVTTQNRYVWKPAIAVSYDISKIISRPK